MLIELVSSCFTSLEINFRS